MATQKPRITDFITARQILKTYDRKIFKIKNVNSTSISFVGGQWCFVVGVSKRLPEHDKLLNPNINIKGLPVEVEEIGEIVAIAADRKISYRPAPPGVSIGHKDITAGTFGCTCSKTGTKYVLSNNHVLANSNVGLVGDNILQPGIADGGTNPADKIGTLAAFVEIIWHQDVPGYMNLVDCAIALPVNEADLLDELLELQYPRGSKAAEVGMQVAKSGRTTAVTMGTINSITSLILVGYPNGKSAYFEDQIRTELITAGGDSGSVLIDILDNKAVGLVFANSTIYSFANLMTVVVGALGITIYDWQPSHAIGTTQFADIDLARKEVTLNGNVPYIYSGNPQRYFEWGTESGSYPNTEDCGVGGVGQFSKVLTLDYNSTYYYRTKVIDGANTNYGVEVKVYLGWQVATSSDDCQRILTADYFSLSGNQVVAGYQQSLYPDKGSAARFLNVVIPSGSTIVSAYFVLKCMATNAYTIVNTRLRAQKDINPATFSNAADFDARIWTTAYVNWDAIPTWTLGVEYTSPDISACIQEVINLANWVSGNPIVVLWDDFEQRSSTTQNYTYRQGYSYDGSVTYAPKLHIKYTQRGDNDNMSTALSTIRDNLSIAMRDYLHLTVTTAIAASTSIVCTSLPEYRNVADYYNGWYVLITSGANDPLGVPTKRQVLDDDGANTLTVRGGNLTTDGSVKATFELHKYDPDIKVRAINSTARKIYPILHKKLDVRELVTGNILPNSYFRDWAVTTRPDNYGLLNVTAIKDTDIGKFGTNQSAYLKATVADGYLRIRSNEYPRLLDLMGKTISFKCWARPTVADDAFLTIYTLQADGTAQTLNSTTATPIDAFTLIELENQTINDNLVQIEFRFRVHTNGEYAFFNRARVTGPMSYELMLPTDFKEGHLSQVWMQSSNYSDDPCDDINPVFGNQLFDWSIVEDGTNKFLRFEKTHSANYLLKLVGYRPTEDTLSAETDRLSLIEPELTLFTKLALSTLYRMVEDVPASEDIGRFERASRKAWGEYRELIPRLSMTKPTGILKLPLR